MERENVVVEKFLENSSYWLCVRPASIMSWQLWHKEHSSFHILFWILEESPTPTTAPRNRPHSTSRELASQGQEMAVGGEWEEEVADAVLAGQQETNVDFLLETSAAKQSKILPLSTISFACFLFLSICYYLQ